jgi:filamentous hemagglutinin
MMNTFDYAAAESFIPFLMKRLRDRASTGLNPVMLALVAALFCCAAHGLRAQTVYNWSGGDIVTGTITPTGVTTVNAVGTLNVTTGADHDFNTLTVTNNGTVNWQAGRLRSGNGGSFNNNAIFNDSSNGYAVNNDFGGASAFVNAATGAYNKTAGVTSFNNGFTNFGTISVSGGSLNLAAGGSFNDGSVVGSSGSGVLQLTGGTLAVNGNVQATNLLFNGGTLAGNQNFVGSTVNWQAGTWNSNNTTTLDAASTLAIMGTSDHDFAGHAIVNNGTVNWSAGRIRSGNGGSITNNGVWNDTSDGYAINSDYGGSTSLVNAASGTYNKTTGVTTFNVGLLNYGTVVVSGGILNLNAGGTFYDGSAIGSTGGGVVQLTAGVLTAGGSSGFTATNFLLTAGQLAGNMTFLGTTNWVGSNFNTAGTATIGATGTLAITGTSDHDFSGHAIVNNGTVNWSAGRIRSGNSGSITNNGVWNDTANGYAVNADFGGGASFINAAGGTYGKTAGVTTFSVGTLVNNGTVSVTGGTINLDGGTLNSGSTIGSSGSGVVQQINGTLTASGTVNVQNFLLNGGTLAGTQTFVGSLNWLASNLSSAGATTLDSTTTLTIAGTNDHDFVGRAIVNDGMVNWSAGRIRSGSGGSITNNGVWNDATSGYAINSDYGGSTSLVNATTGIYNKTGGTTTVIMPVTNAGVINVTGGTLALQSSFASTGTVAVGPGATLTSTSPLAFSAGSLLTGSGAVTASSFSSSGSIDPGSTTTAGQLTLSGNLSLLATSQNAFELGGTIQATQFDYLVVNGSLNLGGNLLVSLINGFDTTVNSAMTFDVIHSTVLSNSFANAGNGSRIATTDGQFTFLVNYGPGSPFGANDLVISDFQAVPEPATWALLLTGTGSLFFSWRRRRKPTRAKGC